MFRYADPQASIQGGRRWLEPIGIAAVSFALALLMASANALAARCNAAVTRGIPGLGAETVVKPGASTVAAGQTFAIHWQRGQLSKRYAAYLMIAFDHPVRFEGKGFYALLPGATAAFGIKAFSDRTRAVIRLLRARRAARRRCDRPPPPGGHAACRMGRRRP